MKGLVAVVLVLIVAGAAFGATPVRVIQGDKSAGGILIGRSTPPQVKRLFGLPSSIRTDFTQSCVQAWSGLRVTVEFFTFEDKPCTKGVALVVTVTGRAGWRTALGLRVGDTVARLRAALPARPAEDGHPGRQRLLARDEEDLRGGRRRLVPGPACPDTSRPCVRVRVADRCLRLADQLEPRAGRVDAGREPSVRGVLRGPLDLAAERLDLLEGRVDVVDPEVDDPA